MRFIGNDDISSAARRDGIIEVTGVLAFLSDCDLRVKTWRTNFVPT